MSVFKKTPSHRKNNEYRTSKFLTPVELMKYDTRDDKLQALNSVEQLVELSDHHEKGRMIQDSNAVLSLFVAPGEGKEPVEYFEEMKGDALGFYLAWYKSYVATGCTNPFMAAVAISRVHIRRACEACLKVTDFGGNQYSGKVVTATKDGSKVAILIEPYESNTVRIWFDRKTKKTVIPHCAPFRLV